MTIENLKQIAIKYATTKGSRVPLAPDELCNAVVQYFNEFLKITADINTIQVAVTEEGGNIVFTITGNTLDGKAFTPIVITVDHNDFVTNQEFEEFKTSVTEQLNNKLNKITSPMSNFVLYANIEGNDTQISYASGPKANSILYRDGTGKTAVVKGVSGQDVANMENLSDITAKIPDVSGFATKEELQNVQNSLNNKRSVISSPASSYVVYTQANGLESNLPYSELANQTSTNIMARRANGTSDVKKGISGENVANMENIAEINSTLNNKLDKVSSTTDVPQVYVKEYNGTPTMLDLSESTRVNSIPKRSPSGRMYTNDGISSEPSSVANMHNIAAVEAKIPDISNLATTEQLQEVENKIPDTSNLATKTELQEVESKIPDTTNFADVTKANTFAEINTFNKRVYFFEIHFEDNAYNVYNTYANSQGIYSKYVADVSENMYNIKELGLYYYCLGTVTNDGMFHEFLFPDEGGTLALTSDIPAIPEYTSVDSVIYDTTNGAIIVYNGANEIHIPLLAGENVTIDASEDNKKIVISAAGGGGTGDVTAAGNNTFTGVNTFNNSIYAKNGVVVGAEGSTNYGANSVRKGPNTYSFPNKSGTFAMTTDVIKVPIYFISFHANDPTEPYHLIGTMMSKNSYGTGQKTNEEFAVMLADNLYTNSNEGLAVYGILNQKDILCIYSEDGLSIRCLDEENSRDELPTIMFFVMETEL